MLVGPSPALAFGLLRQINSDGTPLRTRSTSLRGDRTILNLVHQGKYRALRKLRQPPGLQTLK